MFLGIKKKTNQKNVIIIKSQKNKNPYDICVFKPISGCDDCSLKGRLNCHFDFKILLRFGISFFFVVIFSSYGLILTGHFFEFLIFATALIIFGIIFFGFWEIRILCSHCPLYAKKGRMLHCIGNYGCIKVWRFHPEPMSKSEQIQLKIGFLILFSILIFPALILIINLQFIWGILSAIGVLMFIFVLKMYHCKKCINFSCPFNKLPQDVIDAFLKKNPIIREAWNKYNN